MVAFKALFVINLSVIRAELALIIPFKEGSSFPLQETQTAAISSSQDFNNSSTVKLFKIFSIFEVISLFNSKIIL